MGVPVFKAAGDAADPAVLLVHGYPESSHMWIPALEALAARGLYAIAPDLPGYGDTPPGAGGTHSWERHAQALEDLREHLEIDRFALVAHDWGGLIGLRWACDHPDNVWAIVASDTGFFADARWHDMAKAMRTPGRGEELVDGMTYERFEHILRGFSPNMGDRAIREYYKAFADEPRRRGQLEMYRSGDFEKLEAYDGKLAALDVPFLALWGEEDPFAPVAGAHRFANEIPGARVQVIAGTGHFVFDDAPEEAAEALAAFLSEAAPR